MAWWKKSSDDSNSELESNVAKAIASGHGAGVDVSELQVALNHRKSGRDQTGMGLFKALHRHDPQPKPRRGS